MLVAFLPAAYFANHFSLIQLQSAPSATAYPRKKIVQNRCTIAWQCVAQPVSRSAARLLQLVLVVGFNYEIPTADHFVPRWRLFSLPLPLTYALSTRFTHPLYLGNALNYLKYSLSGSWWQLSSFASLLAFHICDNASQNALLSCQWSWSRSQA